MAAERRYGVLWLICLSALSGVLLAAALPVHNLAFLAWIAFVPLLVVSRMSGYGLAAAGGFVAGLTCAVIVAGPLRSWGQFGNLAAAFGVLGLVLALVAASASYAARRLHPAVWPFFVALTGVAVELLTVLVFPMNVAISQYRNAGMLQLASVTGIWGVSFLLWLTPASILASFDRSRAGLPALALGCAALVWAGVTEFPEQSGRRIEAAAIQAKQPSQSQMLTSRLPRSVRVAVWPEQVMNQANTIAHRTAAANRTCIAANFSQHTSTGLYNVAKIISPAGKTVATFEKQLPFGRENAIFARGHGGSPVTCSGARVGALVCYDTQIPDTARDLVLEDAEIILVPNHDPESPNCLFNHLHGAVISFRAAENGIPIVWADSTGLSRIVDGSGRVLTQAPRKAQTAIWASTPLRSRTTPFTRIGNIFAYVCLATCIAALVVMPKLPRRGSPSS